MPAPCRTWLAKKLSHKYGSRLNIGRLAVVLDGADLTDAQWAVLEPRVVLAVARTAAAGRGPIRALQLRGETVKRVSLIGRNSGGPLCRSQ